MSKKNLIFFNSASSIDLIGGSQRSIEYLILNLFKEYRIYFFCWNFKDDEIVIIKNVDHTIIKIPHPRKNLISFIFSYIKIVKIYKSLSNKFSTIWVHSPLPYIFFKWFNNKNNTLLYSVHGPLITEINYNRSKKINHFFLNFIYKIVLKNTKKIIFNSFYTLKTSIEESNFLHSMNVSVTELLIDEKNFLSNFYKIKKNFNKKEYHNGNFFIIPRRLVKRTGVKIFIKEIINKKIYSKYRFFISGEGDEEHEIKNLCKNIKNIQFLGNIDQDLLTFLISISEGVIIPSIEAEGFCIVAKEAKLLNKFIFHTNQGGLRECLAGYKNQIIFDINNINKSTFIKKTKKLNLNYTLLEKDLSFKNKLTRQMDQ